MITQVFLGSFLLGGGLHTFEVRKSVCPLPDFLFFSRLSHLDVEEGKKVQTCKKVIASMTWLTK